MYNEMEVRKQPDCEGGNIFYAQKYLNENTHSPKYPKMLFILWMHDKLWETGERRANRTEPNRVRWEDFENRTPTNNKERESSVNGFNSTGRLMGLLGVGLGIGLVSVRPFEYSIKAAPDFLIENQNGKCLFKMTCELCVKGNNRWIEGAFAQKNNIKVPGYRWPIGFQVIFQVARPVFGHECRSAPKCWW